MHIGLYTECLTNHITGVETMALMLIEQLKRTQHKLTLFHSNNSRHPIIHGVSHHVFNKPLHIPFYHRLAAFFHTSCFDDVDVLHIQHPQLPFVKKPKSPVIMTVHDVMPAFLPKFFPTKMMFFFRHVLPFYLKKVDKVHAISQTTKTDLIKYYELPADKITVIYPAVARNDIIKSEKKLEKKDIILYVGTLEPRKNVVTLVNAFSFLKKQGNPHTLVIVGKQSWNSNLLFQRIRELKLSDSIVYRGFVSEEEKCLVSKSVNISGCF